MSQSIDRYFNGEHSEMIIILSVATIFIIAAALLFKTGEPFARGVSYPILLTALLFTSVALPLLVRDASKRTDLKAQLERSPDSVKEIETDRIQKVIKAYPYYRYAYLAAILAALTLFVFFKPAFYQGLAAGLLIFATKGYAIDHYSETRARLYLSSLQASKAESKSSD